MAFFRNESYSSGRTSNSGSLSPVSDTSTNTSPASRTSQLSWNKEDTCNMESGRVQPKRTAVALPRASTAGKTGCWTCRIRRKKCDEQRDGGDSGSCHTCKRLKIECLGWGSRRPEWMKEKKAVDDFKARIKETLLANNMIRGQPRTSAQAAAASTSSTRGAGASTPSIRDAGASTSTRGAGASSSARARAPTQPYPTRPSPTRSPRSRPTSATRPSSSAAPAMDNLDYTYGNTGTRHRSSTTLTVPPSIGMSHHRHSYHGGSSIDLGAGPSQLDYYHLPSASYSDPNVGSLDMASFFVTESSTFPDLHTPDLPGFDPLTLTVPDVPYNVPLTPPQTFASGQSDVQHQLVQYYFEHVRKMQFMFASNEVANMIVSIILQDSSGPVTNAICALSSFHFGRMQVIDGLQAPGQNMENARFFSNAAWEQMVHSKLGLGHHTENDAIAALHLISYSVLSTGAIDWTVLLDVACEWVEGTGITRSDSPKFMLSKMGEVQAFAVKMTVFFDIIASMTLMKAPKFMTLYRHLLGSNTGLWAGSSIDVDDPPHMEALTGYPNDVLLGMAQVSELAQWKTSEQQKGRLSTRELIRRGDVIEQQLRVRTPSNRDAYPLVEQAALHPRLPSAASVDFNSMSHASMSQPDQMTIPFPTDEMRRVVANIFRESVVLYLHTVLSEPVPGVPEIENSVKDIIQLFSRLPATEVDRSLVFPLCIAGSMTDDGISRDLLKSRLLGQHENIGNIGLVRALMEAVWRQRDVGGGAVDWRETMHDNRLNLLLI